MPLKDPEARREYYRQYHIRRMAEKPDHVRAISARAGKTWKSKNPDKVKAKAARMRERNREKLSLAQREYMKTPAGREARRKYDSTRKAKDARNAYARERRRADPSFKMSHYLRAHLRKAIRLEEGSKLITYVGCSVEHLKAHLERQFVKGMTWENWGRGGWHIDHIRPLARFDLTDADQLRQAWHFTNLRPLWEMANLKKGVRCELLC